MISDYTDKGVLPPFLGSATATADRSPYPTTILEFAHRFGTTPARRELLHGFLAYRRKLQSFGLTQGFQWVDGSFVEDSERLRGSAPADIDVVTFAPLLALRPCREQLLADIRQHAALFDADSVRSIYRCDSYFVDTVSLSPAKLIECAAYWCSLFGHRRDNKRWKGFVKIDLADSSDVLSENGRFG